MICGKVMALRGGVCEPCQEKVRREALGDQADQELKKHGVTPELKPLGKKPIQ